MGLSCNKAGTDNYPSSLETKCTSWTRLGGYVFRPVFLNELNHTDYQKTQLEYLIHWTSRTNNFDIKRSEEKIELIYQWRENIKRGVPDSLLRLVVLKIFQVEFDDNYWRVIKECFQGRIPDDFDTVPTFCSIERIDQAVPKLYLNSAGITALKRVLWGVYSTYSCLNYSPQLPPLVSILLIYLNEDEAYQVVCKLIECSDTVYLLRKISEFKEFIERISRFISLKVKDIKVYKDSGELDLVIAELIRTSFIGYFRIPCIMRINLNFLAEGLKAIEKFICALFFSMPHEALHQSVSLLESVQLYTFSLSSCESILESSFLINFTEHTSTS